jgi:hypothetical protein
MKSYDEVMAAIRGAIEAAKRSQKKQFALELALDLLALPAVAQAGEQELNPPAQQALRDAAQNLSKYGQGKIRRQVDTIVGGVLDEGNMSAPLSFAIEGLMAYYGARSFFGTDENLVQLVEIRLEAADFEDPSPNDDPLSSEAFAEQYRAIMAGLGAAVE